MKSDTVTWYFYNFFNVKKLVLLSKVKDWGGPSGILSTSWVFKTDHVPGQSSPVISLPGRSMKMLTCLQTGQLGVGILLIHLSVRPSIHLPIYPLIHSYLLIYLIVIIVISLFIWNIDYTFPMDMWQVENIIG